MFPNISILSDLIPNWLSKGSKPKVCQEVIIVLSQRPPQVLVQGHVMDNEIWNDNILDKFELITWNRDHLGLLFHLSDLAVDSIHIRCIKLSLPL